MRPSVTDHSKEPDSLNLFHIRAVFLGIVKFLPANVTFVRFL